jgi:hypothetical protein
MISSFFWSSPLLFAVPATPILVYASAMPAKDVRAGQV